MKIAIPTARFGTPSLPTSRRGASRRVMAIANTANNALAEGSGVTAGPALAEECRRILHTQLRSRQGLLSFRTSPSSPGPYVIHTVGPIYHRRGSPAHALLRL